MEEPSTSFAAWSILPSTYTCVQVTTVFRGLHWFSGSSLALPVKRGGLWGLVIHIITYIVHGLSREKTSATKMQGFCCSWQKHLIVRTFSWWFTITALWSKSGGVQGPSLSLWASWITDLGS
jgi:hypothetical protein